LAETGAGGHVNSYNTTAIYQTCRNTSTFAHSSADYFVVPKPSLPRPVYKMMPSSSPKFMGCEDYLQKLDEFFHVRTANDLTRRVFVLFGVGGVGKTQICLKFAEKSSDK
jgi:flagellar biosynthesis GTPase FlhF